MRGRNAFMESLIAHGVERIFGNPGTTESPLLDSLAAYPAIKYVTALHEGVVLAMASYYAQASGKAGVVSLHVAPGLGNALGMLYCAMRANSPLIVTAGQQDTRMRLADPVLRHDLVAMAAPLVKWSVEVAHADEMAPILRRAFKIAHDGPPGPVFVSLPINVMEEETSVGAEPPGMLRRRAHADPEGIAEAARLLAQAERPVIVCGDDVARSGAVAQMVRLAEATGASVWREGLHLHAAFPSGHPSARLALPLDAGGIAKALAGADVIVLAGGPFFEHVWHTPVSPFPTGARIVHVEESPQRLGYNHAPDVGLVGNLALALGALAEAVDKADSGPGSTAVRARNDALSALKEREAAVYRERMKKAWDRQPISMPRVMAEIRSALPARCVVVDETITANIDLARTFDFTDAGDYFGARGGGIGQGLPGALGVQIADPNRPVVCISGDGSAMYSIQALWTAAHLDLPVVFVILANREYRVLKHNIDVYRQRFGITSQEPYAHMDLARPTLGFVQLAAGMGVAGTLVEKAEAVRPAIEAAFTSGKPHLVEVVIEAKR